MQRYFLAVIWLVVYITIFRPTDLFLWAILGLMTLVIANLMPEEWNDLFSSMRTFFFLLLFVGVVFVICLGITLVLSIPGYRAIGAIFIMFALFVAIRLHDKPISPVQTCLFMMLVSLALLGVLETITWAINLILPIYRPM